jgi:cytochrome c
MRLGLMAVLAAAGSASLAVGVANAAGDADAGKDVFKKCAVCHSPDKGVNKIGPSLFGIVGSKSAEVPGYTFSKAMQDANKTWDDAALDAYLTNPREVVPGTKMIFPGLKNEADRANVIAYLATLK